MFFVLPVVTIAQFQDPDAWHFVNIFVHAIRMLLESSVTIENLRISQKLLDIFVDNLPHFVSQDALTFNVHTLRHLSSHVRRYGAISYLHASVFESWLGWCKKVLSGTNNTLGVVARRYIDFKNTVTDRQRKKTVFLLGTVSYIDSGK